MPFGFPSGRISAMEKLLGTQDIDSHVAHAIAQTVAPSVVLTANEFIKAHPSLEKRLKGLTEEGMGNIQMARVLGKWAGDAGTGNQEALNALVLTGGFMYQGWDEVITDGATRGFIAAKACSILLSLDGPRPTGPITTYGKDAFRDVIFPVVTGANTLGDEGLAVFLKATQRDTFSSDPYHIMNGHVGFRNKVVHMKDTIAYVLGKVASHIPGLRPKE